MKLYQITLLSGYLLGVLSEEDGSEGEGNYRIEGKVTPPDLKTHGWMSDVTVIVDGGRRRAFIGEDNSFTIQVRGRNLQQCYILVG